MAKAQGKDELAGAAGASTGELTAKLALDLYGKKPEQLGEVRDSWSVRSRPLPQAGKNAVENNAISDIVENKLSGMTQAEKYAKAQSSLIQSVKEYKSKLCIGISDEACS
ncbi:hypothetical protein ACINJI_003910 [Cronobacter dublinensis]